MTDSSQHASKTSPNRGVGLTPYAIPIILVHVLALLVFVPWFFSWTGLIIMVVGVFVFGQGINLGYHRLLTHRSLRVPLWLEHAYVMLALCCLEESPAKWVSTHRLHHAHSDDQQDPHSPTRTFFWSHMGWLIQDRPNQNQLGVHLNFAADILRDRFYRFLENAWWFGLAVFVAQLAIYFGIGYAAASLMGMEGAPATQFAASITVWGVLARTVVVWHITWSVNSLGHVFGYRNYSTNENSKNNWLVALLASGEGWHNNHHHDPASASVQHKWWEMDVTYYQILVLEKLGLAKDVIRPRHVRQGRTTSDEQQRARAADAKRRSRPQEQAED